MHLFKKSDNHSNKSNHLILKKPINVELNFNDNCAINIAPKDVIVSKDFIVKDTVMMGTIGKIIDYASYWELEIRTSFGTVLSHIDLKPFKKMDLKLHEQIYLGFDNKNVQVVNKEVSSELI